MRLEKLKTTSINLINLDQSYDFVGLEISLITLAYPEID